MSYKYLDRGSLTLILSALFLNPVLLYIDLFCWKESVSWS